MSDLSDEEVVRSCIAGNRKHCRLIYERHKDTVAGLIYRWIGDSGLARDLTQDTFVRVYKGLKRFRFDSSLKTWICTIATNICKDRLKQAKTRHENGHVPLVDPEEGGVGELPFSGEDADPESALLRKEADAAVRSAVDGLPEEQRQAILFQMEGRSYDEIAENEGVSKETVGTRIYYAKKKLAKVLKAHSK